MIITNSSIHKLNSTDFQIANRHLKEVIKKSNLSDNDLLKILMLDNKLIISEFFHLQPKFSTSNLIVTENFINANLGHKNKLFVSDLLEIAVDFNLNINYRKCIGLLKKHKADNYYVLMSAMEYIYSNLKTNYISEIIPEFTRIMNSKEIAIPARLKASFYLYRITYKKIFYTKLKRITANDPYNKEIVLNLLKNDSNQLKNFEGYKSVLEITKR